MAAAALDSTCPRESRFIEDVHLIQEQVLRRNVKRFRGGLVFKAHRLGYHSTLRWRVIKKKKKKKGTYI